MVPVTTWSPASECREASRPIAFAHPTRRDWQPLTALYREHGLIPIRSAREMSEQDLALAALMDEAPTA